jgi:hypothetical protein
MKFGQLVQELPKRTDTRTQKQNTTSLALLGKLGKWAKIVVNLTSYNNHHSPTVTETQNTSKIKGSSAWCLLQAGFLLGLFFGPEDRDMFLRNVG